MRYAFDFIPVDSTGAMARGDEARNEAWLGWGARVLAPAGGRIVQLHDGDADNRQIDMPAVMRDPVALYGNYIVIGVEGLPAYFGDYVLRRGARTIDVQRRVPGTGDIVERR